MSFVRYAVNDLERDAKGDFIVVRGERFQYSVVVTLTTAKTVASLVKGETRDYDNVNWNRDRKGNSVRFLYAVGSW